MDEPTPMPRPRRARLTRSGDFDTVYRRGRSASGRHLVVYAFRREEGIGADGPRLGLSVSRKVGGSVERNRVKRVIRERFAEIESELPYGTHFVVIARPGIVEHLDEHGSGALAERLHELARRVAAEATAV